MKYYTSKMAENRVQFSIESIQFSIEKQTEQACD